MFICLSFRLFVRSCVYRHHLRNLELLSLLTTNRKSYMGFSKNTFLDPYDDLERQQTSPRATLMALAAYRVDLSERYFCSILGFPVVVSPGITDNDPPDISTLT